MNTREIYQDIAARLGMDQFSLMILAGHDPETANKIEAYMFMAYCWGKGISAIQSATDTREWIAKTKNEAKETSRRLSEFFAEHADEPASEIYETLHGKMYEILGIPEETDNSEIAAIVEDMKQAISLMNAGYGTKPN